jgi:hypothetical protein
LRKFKIFFQLENVLASGQKVISDGGEFFLIICAPFVFRPGLPDDTFSNQKSQFG